MTINPTQWNDQPALDLIAAYEPENWLVMAPGHRYEILVETERVLLTQAERLGEAGVAALKAKRQQAIALLRERG